jgi:hypothetical protein
VPRACGVADEDVDDVGVDVRRVPPDQLEQLVAGEDVPAVAAERLEEREVAAGQLEVATCARGDVAAWIDHEVTGDDRAGAVAAAAAQQRLQAGCQLGEREWLDQVVVSARLQAADAVLHLVAGG